MIYGFGKRSSLRSKPIRSTQQPTTHSTESQLRIQLKARNKSVRQQARLTKSQNTSLNLQSRPFGGCELLQNVYLCSSKHNYRQNRNHTSVVVNCFKMCIFAVASTMKQCRFRRTSCCELLQNVYLCSSKHNLLYHLAFGLLVVNCFKMCIFAVASTIIANCQYIS